MIHVELALWDRVVVSDGYIISERGRTFFAKRRPDSRPEKKVPLLRLGSGRFPPSRQSAVSLHAEVFPKLASEAAVISTLADSAKKDANSVQKAKVEYLDFTFRCCKLDMT